MHPLNYYILMRITARRSWIRSCTDNWGLLCYMEYRQSPYSNGFSQSKAGLARRASPKPIASIALQAQISLETMITFLIYIFLVFTSDNRLSWSTFESLKWTAIFSSSSLYNTSYSSSRSSFNLVINCRPTAMVEQLQLGRFMWYRDCVVDKYVGFKWGF